MPPLFNLHRAADATQLAHDLADFVAQRLRDTLSRRGHALLVVSGGSTPVPFLRALSAQSLDWARVAVTLADERWLPPDHIDSNERLVRQHLLQGEAEPARFVPLWRDQPDPYAAQDEVAASLQSLPWPASVVVLGMGGDGHTASLFPGDRAWASRVAPGQRCVAVDAPAQPNVPVARISLTPACLLDAEQVVIHITGSGKWGLLQQAAVEGSADELPIRWALHQSESPCHVFYAD